jgi:superfamily II DNA/RNA helicase
MTFEELGLNDEILEAIDYMGFEKATEIQEKAIPLILKNKDLLGCAQTGTGKTAAFILPVLHQMAHEKHSGITTLIIVPTRELAKQIDQQIQGFSYFIPVTSITIYGGGSSDWEKQKKAIKEGVDIIVATPGKFITHLTMGYVDLKTIKFLILDEADRMLDMGFVDDIMKIIGFLPKKRQTLLFSATMPPKIKKLAEQIMVEPEEITLSLSKPAEGVLQGAYLVHSAQKIELINHLIRNKEEDYASILIFSSTKKNVGEIVRSLKTNGYDAAGISSDFDQKEREEVLSKFRAKKIRILVATDVLSRGIDIKDINLVINYDVPSNAEDYVHRVGRTARAKTTGVALTFINERDIPGFAQIEELIERQVLKLPLPKGFEKGPEWRTKRSPSRQFKKHRNYKRNKRKKRS